MQSLLEHLICRETGKAVSSHAQAIPAWAPAQRRSDPVEQFLSRSPGNAELSNFARNTTRACKRVDGRNHYSELLVIPILHPGPVPLAHNPQIWQEASEPLLQELVQLFPAELHIGFFRAVTSVEDMCGMPWQAIRAHLEPHPPQTGAPAVQEFERLYGRLPNTVPQLGFVVVRASSRHVWPSEWLNQSPVNTSHAQSQPWNQTLLRAARILQLAAWETPLREPDLPHVLPPRAWSQGIGAGICAWLQVLHATCILTDYELALDPRDLDLRSLEIGLASGGPETSDGDGTPPIRLRLGIRRHALTPDTWGLILNTLQGMVTMPGSHRSF